jgi:hypothetical protein
MILARCEKEYRKALATNRGVGVHRFLKRVLDRIEKEVQAGRVLAHEVTTTHYYFIS